MQVPILQNEALFTFLKPHGRDLSFRIGDVVKAEVLKVLDSGSVSLRITTGEGQSGILVAKSGLQLAQGSVIRLKVAGGDNEIKLQYLGLTADSSTRTRIEVEQAPARLFQALTELAGARLKADDLAKIGDLFRSLPQQIKAAFPEFAKIEHLLPQIEKLNAEILKTAVEGSGVLLETRLRLAAEGISRTGSSEALRTIFGEKPDQKALLLSMKDMLQDNRVIEALRAAGTKPAEISASVDRLIRNIEFFQLSSRINDIFYTFLPVSWQEMKEGEIAFRKEHDAEGTERYGCDITLDLQPLGRLRISVSLFRDELYVTLSAEDSSSSALIERGREALEEQFVSAGLRLRAVNVTQKAGIGFSPDEKQGLDLKA